MSRYDFHFICPYYCTMKWVILVFALLTGLLSLFYGSKLFGLWRRMKNWIEAEAEILSKEIAQKKLSSGGRANSVIKIEYRFRANGKKTAGNKVFPIEYLKGEKGFLKKDSEKFLEKLPGKTRCWFNPVNPEESILFREGALMALLMLFMGGFCLLFGLFAVITLN